MIRVWIIVMCVLVATGCGRDEPLSPPPKSGAQSYLLFDPPSEQRGWDAIFALRDTLPTRDAKRIRMTGLISSRMTTMYVDADASCTRDTVFIRNVQAIVRSKGIAKVTCSATLPEAR